MYHVYTAPNGRGLLLISQSSIIPISDNGGSSSELIRVFGGPGIGDVRSKLSEIFHSLILREV